MNILMDSFRKPLTCSYHTALIDQTKPSACQHVVLALDVNACLLPPRSVARLPRAGGFHGDPQREHGAGDVSGDGDRLRVALHAQGTAAPLDTDVGVRVS